ncbi:Spo0E family sporulation regulatory protein-aspartic acid phosphatase [Cohnella boryungensis]|uniref:Spo0E family sporulation regulatory protein-aspartic acid phosphatase n=1 Tax=Cohnella boryungensis TaxID=768479 RepID=A0ABV8SCS3_9BACL
MTKLETTQLIGRLQLLQRRLCEMADDLGNLTDPEIVAVSEEADRLIVQLQLLRKKELDVQKETIALLAASQSAEKIGEQGRAFFAKHSS